MILNRTAKNRMFLFKRLRSEESGFTLVELLVTILMLTTVLFALYGIFDMSLRVFSVSNDRTEANGKARLALERMEREIRMAFPGNKKYSRPGLLCATGSTYCTLPSDTRRIAFGNDLNGSEFSPLPADDNTSDPDILNCTSATSCASYDPDELISYCAPDNNGDGIGDTTIHRATGSGGCTPGVSPKLADLGRDGTMKLTYLARDNTNSPADPDRLLDEISPPLTGNGSTATEPKVLMVEIELNVRVDRGPGDGTLQKLTTDVTLRNRNR